MKYLFSVFVVCIYLAAAQASCMDFGDDFEDGNILPWGNTDIESVWILENWDYLDPDWIGRVPEPPSGPHFLLFKHLMSDDGGFGMVFSPPFEVTVGTKIYFDFWIRAQNYMSNNLYLVQINPINMEERVLLDLTHYASQSNYVWRTEWAYVNITGEREEIEIGFRAYTGNLDFDGAAVDNVRICLGNLTSTEPTPTAAPTTTAAAVTTTQGETTTEYVIEHIFDFENGTQDWILGSCGGSHFNRYKYTDGCGGSGGPPCSIVLEEYALRVVRDHDYYAGVTLAVSPEMEILYNNPKVEVIFWVKGTPDYPTELKVFRLVGGVRDETPFLTLNQFGETQQAEWLIQEASLPGNVRDVFRLQIDGYLNMEAANMIMIERVSVTNVDVKPYNNDMEFDFENNKELVYGANENGGTWWRVNYTTIDNGGIYIPKPAGDWVGLLRRCSRTNSLKTGVISLETPPIKMPEVSDMWITTDYYIRGTNETPSNMYFRLRSEDGVYMNEPYDFIDEFGNQYSEQWRRIGIQVKDVSENFQVIFEGYTGAGGDATNLLAIDKIVVEYYKKQKERKQKHRKALRKFHYNSVLYNKHKKL